MRNYFANKTLSPLQLSVLDIIKQIGFKSAFQMADKLANQYDTLTVMRSLHTLLQMDLLERYNIQGERYYKLNEKQLPKIKLLLTQTNSEIPILSQSKA
jgi:hypothetical protein